MMPLPLLPSIPPEFADNPIAFLAVELSWKPASIEVGRQLFSRGLPPLASFDTLPFIFGISPALILEFRRNTQRYYRTFTIPKRNGALRSISAPRVALKVIQRWIHDHILSRGQIAIQAHAFYPRRDIFSNAEPHLGARNMMSLDIEDFFSSIKRASAASVFVNLGFHDVIATQLSWLCTLDERLPQGAPTSPMLSNLVFRPVDEALVALAAELNAQYSRYADDLTFSSDTHSFTVDDVRRVQAILRQSGFQLNARKTKLIGSGYRHQAAGLSTSGGTAIAIRWRRRQWRAAFHQARTAPERFAGRSSEFLGIAGFVAQYDAELGAVYKSIARSLPPSEPHVTAPR